MATSLRESGPPAALARYPHRAAFSIQLGRNGAVQALGLSMVALMGLLVLPWAVVLAWSAMAVAVIVAEHRLLRLIAQGGPVSRAARFGSPALRVVTTTLYAGAALALFVRGGQAERLFAFALICASMVHVLMRHYRSPWVLAASLSPYVFVLAACGAGWTRAELAQGRWLAALAPSFTAAMLAVQFWSARAQLAGAWTQLTGALQAAEEREHAAQAANHAKSQFLATMSHELRTPLNGVLGMAQVLARDDLTAAQRQRVGVIRRSGESLLAVLNDLLDLSRIEASALKIDAAPFDLEHMVRGVASVYAPSATAKGLTFDFQIAEQAKGQYLGDGPRVRRVLHGLCDNAIKFTEHGGADLTVGLEGGRIVFRVADTGIGIAKDHLAHLFDGFFQADSSATRRYGGTGVGLAICGKLAGLMDGEIEASSEPGRGSVFAFRLPLERIAAAGVPDIAAAEPERAMDLRVLAAEDNAANQLVLKSLLAPAGIEPTLVVNGLEAVAAWEGQTWDLVLMDIQMPEMDGVEATRLIRRREEETGRSRTPILAVTANAMVHQLAEYHGAGMDGVVAKPFDVAALFRGMEAALAQPAPAPTHAAQRTVN